jgi:alkaline phosphatase D
VIDRRTKAVVFLSLCAALFLPVCHTNAAQQYKRHARQAISDIVDGDCDAAIEHFRDYLAKNPDDLESLYGLAVAYAQKRDIDKAMQYVRQAIDAGLPFARFLAGPRGLLEPLTESAEFKKWTAEQPVDLVHGPMLGCVTDTSARFWVRTADETVVKIHVGNANDPRKSIELAVGRTRKEDEYTTVLPVNDLEPGTAYYYQLVVAGKKCPKRRSFRTFPAVGKPSKFQVAFGGGAGYTPWHERMWNTIAAREPIAFLLLGDNVYIDNPTRGAVQQYCYYRRQSRPEFRSFTAGTAIYAIWDDHDFTTNDGWGGPDIYEPPWKIPVWNVFKDNWNNPSYGGGRDQPGCWFDFSIGDVDFFMLDCRYYRTDPKVEKPSMLGPAQKKWLLRKLEASKGTFRVLASSVPWAFGTKPGSLDTWEGYKRERQEIFSFLEEHNIGGVLLISADRHRSDVWKIERPNDYDLYEFESSRLTNVHSHRVMPDALFGYNKKCSFGSLSFDTTLPDPQVSYRIINIDGEVVHTFSLKRSQLASEKKE